MDGTRKAKTKRKLNLARNENNRMGFYRYVSEKRKVEEKHLSHLVSKAYKLTVMYKEKVEVSDNSPRPSAKACTCVGAAPKSSTG